MNYNSCLCVICINFIRKPTLLKAEEPRPCRVHWIEKRWEEAAVAILGTILIKKTEPLLAWSGPESSRNLRFPRFHDNGTGRW